MREARFRSVAVPQFSAGPSAAPTVASGIRQPRRRSDAGGDAQRRACARDLLGRENIPLAPRECVQTEASSRVSCTPAGRGALTPPGPLIRLVSKTLLKTGAWTILRVLERDLVRTGAATLPRPTSRCFARAARGIGRSHERGSSVSSFMESACGSRPPQPPWPTGPRGMRLAGLLRSDAEPQLGVPQESER
jgi:hypothetical protein